MKATFIQSAGQRLTVDVDEGTSLMQAAVAHSIEGIVGECGGSMMCATCHVYVEEESARALAPVSLDESATLDAVSSERRANSRLSCQLVMSSAIDGIVVEVANVA